MKIGIFGGSFNPPHKMHKAIAKELINKKYVDLVIIVPTGIKYHYKNNLLGNDIRYRLLKEMTKNEDNILISTYEFQEKEVLRIMQDSNGRFLISNIDADDEIIVSDVNGHLYRECIRVDNRMATIDLSSCHHGIYIIKIGKMQTIKITWK